ncbi:MAG: class I SAM-dependent methyltransferase [Hyphomicrobiales bacterium]|nr:class I SAM-dependent methyltransferase [Hyphomicrobiales bacterium]
MSQYKYLLSNEWERARERLSLLEALHDPWTIRNFGKLGVKDGWRCLEIGGGGGSIAAWLCRQVGGSGHVVATDLDPRFLLAIQASNLEVWRHDILCEPLPEGVFDLVHARLVLMFLPKPAETIAKMTAALRPGGWLLLEEGLAAIPDPSMTPAAMALSTKGQQAMLSLAKSRGVDVEFGRRLYHELSANGLSDLQAEGLAPMRIGGTPSARFWKITVEQVQDQILEARLLTQAELEDYRCLLDSPEYRWFAPIMMSVWGRRIAPQ